MSRHRQLIHEDDYDDYDYDYEEPDAYEGEAYSQAASRSSQHYSDSLGRKADSKPVVVKAAAASKEGRGLALSIKPVAGGVSLPGKASSKGVCIAPPNAVAKDSSRDAIPSRADAVGTLSQFSSDLQAMGFEDNVAAYESLLAPAVSGLSARDDNAKAKGQAEGQVDVADMSDDDIDLNFSKESGLAHLSLVVVGHVDSGKSTLVGHLLYKRGGVSQRQVHKFEKESKASGKGSFYLAWIMDESDSEREHGVTINVAQRSFSTASKAFTILDSPGHKDFMPNMISGCSSVDVAMLVVPATTGEFESSMSLSAQTREHALILKSMGVHQLLVAVNKMDATSPPWSQARFEEVKTLVLAMLVELNFASKAIRFVPVSGLTGENLVDTSPHVGAALAWHTSGTLLLALDSFKVPPRAVDRPLRALVTHVVSSDDKGVELGVCVVQGRMRVGRSVALVGSAVLEVRRIVSGAEAPQHLCAGELGVVSLALRKGARGGDVYAARGMVLFKGAPHLRSGHSFRATIVTTSSLEVPIIPGSCFELYLHGEEVQCRVAKIYSLLVPGTGGEEARTVHSPKCVGAGRQAVVKVVAESAVCVEPFEACKALGRFALRSRGRTAAVGIVNGSS